MSESPYASGIARPRIYDPYRGKKKKEPSSRLLHLVKIQGITKHHVYFLKIPAGITILIEKRYELTTRLPSRTRHSKTEKGDLVVLLLSASRRV